MTARTYGREEISAIVARHGPRPELLVQILADVVARYGWITADAIRQLADELNLSRAEVHGVVSFYHDFRTEPPGRHVVKLCQAEACRSMGAEQLAEHAARRLGIGLNEHGESVSLEPVYCLGNCACSPAVMIDERVYGRVDKQRFDELVGAFEEALP